MEFIITGEAENLVGLLAACVAAANAAWWKRRQYTMEYYGGKYVWVYWLPYVKNDNDRTEVVKRDTPATEEKLIEAINLVQKELEAAA